MTVLTLEAKIGEARRVLRSGIREQLECSMPRIARISLDQIAGEVLTAITRPTLRDALQVLSCDSKLPRA